MIKKLLSYDSSVKRNITQRFENEVNLHTLTWENVYTSCRKEEKIIGQYHLCENKITYFLGNVLE